MKKQHYLSLGFLIFFPLLLIVISKPDNMLFASQIDYLSQHITVPDYLRQLFYESGTLFNDYAPHLQGGTNIYSFSYYGLFRPDVLLSYLLPMVSMKTILITYSIFLISLGSCSLFVWLSKKGMSWNISLFAAILYTCSSIFFHSHRQIMFVNFMPFLIIAFISIDHYFKTKKLYPFTISMILIILHSYFFAIAAIVICMIYFLLQVPKHTQIRKALFPLLCSITIAILCCFLLLLPTAYVILANSKEVASTNLTQLVLPNLSLEGLLYNPYGCGLTMLCWAGLAIGISHKKTKILSWILIACFSLPMLTYILNGTLYVRYKILIVCLPLVLYVLCEVIQARAKQQLHIAWYSIVLLFIPVFFLENKLLVLIDIAFTIAILYWITKPKRTHVIFVYTLLVLVLFSQVNTEDTYLKQSLYDNVLNQDKQHLIEANIHDERFMDFSDNFYSANFVPSMHTMKLSSYTSTNNTDYNRYLYDVMNAPISIANRTANLDNSHIFIQSMLGVKNIITTNKVPVGYTCKEKQGKYQYCRNDDVLEKAYATSQTISEKTFDQLLFPYTLDTLHNNAVVKQGENTYESKIKKEEVNPTITKKDNKVTIEKNKDSYRIKAKKNASITLDLNLENPKQITIVSFDVKTNKNKDTKETMIAINNIKNKLSKGNAPYPNGNQQFVYVISDQQAISTLSVKLYKGDYTIQNIQLYTLDYEVLKNYTKQVDPLKLQATQNDEVLKGNIQVKEDGYFVTSIPYEKGFEAFVDGKKIEIEKVNKAFVGFPIKAGQHSITITFHAPFKKVAMLFSIIGFLLLLLQIYYERKQTHE